MIDSNHIIKVAGDLGRMANAESVILFGSYARGDADEDSDVDLMIVVETDLPRFKRSRDLYKAIRPYPFGMDILVYTPKEIEKGRKSPVSFVSTVLKEGKTVYVGRDSKTVAGESPK